MDTTKAKRAYKEFTGHTPKKTTVAKLDASNVAGWKLGQAVGVAYEATRDGETERYFHEFKKSARPDLVSRDDGKQLYFTGGRYKVTDRGIEDMPSLFVINPSPRKGAKKGKTMARKRRRTSVRRRRTTTRVATFARNPIRRRRRRTSVRSFARNPIRRRRRVSVKRYRRNPSARRMMGGVGKLSSMVMPAVAIGAGAVGAEVLMGYLPLPAQLKTGVMRHVTKGGVGIVGGIILGKVFKQPKLGKFFAAGAIAIATHDAIKEALAARMPSLKFGGGMGAYLPRSAVTGSLGYYSPAGTVDYSAMGEYVAPFSSSLGGSPDFEA